MAYPGVPCPIIAFHQDDSGDWVAELACGHAQHVRHRPPWELRPWVVTAAGREQHIGAVLVCLRCPPSPAESESTEPPSL